MKDIDHTCKNAFNWDTVMRALPHSYVRLKAKDVLPLTSRCDEVGCVISGVLLTTAIDDYGRQKALWLAGAHHLYMQEPTDFYFTVKALTDASILWTGRRLFTELLQSDATLLDQYLADSSQNLNNQITHLLRSQEYSGRARLYDFLIQLTTTYGRPENEKNDSIWLLPNIFPREDLASLAGIHQSNCSRYLTELRRARIMIKHAHDDACINLPALRQILNKELTRKK